MTARDVGTIILRLFGVFLLVDGLRNVAMITQMFQLQLWQSTGAGAAVPPFGLQQVGIYTLISAGTDLVLAILFLTAAGGISALLFRSDTQLQLGQFSVEQLNGFAFQLLGVYFVVTYGGQSIVGLARWFKIKASGSMHSMEGQMLQGELHQQVILPLVVFVPGIVLMLWGRQVASKLRQITGSLDR